MYNLSCIIIRFPSSNFELKFCILYNTKTVANKTFLAKKKRKAISFTFLSHSFYSIEKKFVAESEH